MLQTPRKQWARFALTAACAALPLAGLGCDDSRSQSDRKVRQVLFESRIAKTDDLAIAVLQTANSEQQASPAAQANVRTRMAQISYAKALSILPELNDKEMAAAAAMRDIGRLGMRIFESNQAITAYRGMNPTGKEPFKVLEKAKADLTTRISGIDKSAGVLNQKINTKAAEIAKLTADRDGASGQFAALLNKAEQAKDEDGLNLFKQAADFRGKAAILNQSLEAATSDINHLRDELAGLTEEKKVTQEGIVTLQKQADTLANSWKETQKAIAAQSQAAKAIVAESGIDAKAKQAAALMSEADALREQARKYFNDAINNYEEARKAANTLDGELTRRINDYRTAPEASAWKVLKEIHSVTGYHLAKAQGYQTLGNVYAGERAVLMNQQRLAKSLAPVFAQAGLSLPEELSPASLDAKIAAASKAAGQCFAEAEKILQDVTDRGTSAEKSEARSLRVSNSYVVYRLTGKKENLDVARQMLTDLVQASENASEVANSLPVLPNELVDGIVKRSAVSVEPPKPKPVTPVAATPPGGRSKESQTWLKMLGRGAGALAPQGGPEAPPSPPAPAPQQ